MIDTSAAALLARLQRQGLHLSTTPEGALQVWPAVWLDESTREAITAHKADLLALLTAPAVDPFADDRHRCRDCYHLQSKGNCAMAAQGRFTDVTRWYTPDKNILARCHLFCALPY